jgi:hypothetical protein
MNDFVSLLLFVVLLVLMMRFGCGMHGMHGSGRRKQDDGDGEHSHQH